MISLQIGEIIFLFPWISSRPEFAVRNRYLKREKCHPITSWMKSYVAILETDNTYVFHMSMRHVLSVSPPLYFLSSFSWSQHFFVVVQRAINSSDRFNILYGRVRGIVSNIYYFCCCGIFKCLIPNALHCRRSGRNYWSK